MCWGRECFRGGRLEKTDDDMGPLEVWSTGCLLIAKIPEFGNILFLG